MGKKNPCQGKHREFGNVSKTQGIWFAQFVNSLNIMMKDISIFATKISNFYLSFKSAKSVLCVGIVTNHVNWHRENLQSDGENTGNMKIHIEWVPCKLYMIPSI